MRRKLYMYDKKRIIHLENFANEKFWDDRWNIEENFDYVRNFRDSTSKLIVNKTKKYLSKDSKILEGGCGMGDKVYQLQRAGFDTHGVDFAKKTVTTLNKNFPDLKIILGDVRKLPFEDCSFDGYWSLGVIEHFYRGYDDISSEMKRVIKTGGYLFITVPTFSLLRRIKAILGFYEKVDSSFPENKNFYQFLISKSEVINHFEKIGFELIEFSYRGGISGLLDESGLKINLVKLGRTKNYDNNGNKLKKKIFEIIAKLLNALLNNFSGHTMFLVFRKVDSFSKQKNN